MMSQSFRLIHVVTTISRGGAENHLLTLASEQVRNGLEVHVIPLKGDMELLKSFVENGINVITDLHEQPFLKQIQLMKNQLKEREPTIVHAHLPRAELLLTFIRLKAKFIISRHNTEKFHPRWPEILSSLLSRIVTWKAESVIMISKAVKSQLIKRKEISKTTNIFVVYYGIEKNKFAMSTIAPLIDEKIQRLREDDTFIVSSVARLVPQKDIPTLLKGFQIFKNQNPKSALMIAGEGKEEHSLRNLSQSLGLQDSVHWLGRIENPVDLMRQSDLFVLSSLYEGFGLVLLEAMSVKTPIIAANNSAIPEVLGEDYTGLFETGNAEDLCKKLIKFAEFDQRANATNSCTERLNMFSVERMFQETTSVYESVFKK